MRKHLYHIVISITLVFCTNIVFGQAFNPYQHSYQGWDGDKIKKASPFRAFLNNFSLDISIGYGRTFYSHVVNSDVLETPEKLIMLGDYTQTGNTVDYTGVVDWLNAPSIVTGTEVVGSGNNILYSDTSEIKYSGSGYNIPLNVSLHFDIDRFRIGGGFIYELHGLNNLNPKGQGVYPYIPNFNTTSMIRYFFTAGAKVYHILGWDYYVDFQIGKVKYGKEYDKSSLQNGVYFNLGFPLEYEFSEYFWLFLRPSFDFKNYNMTISQNDGSGAPSSVIFQHNQPALYLSFGVRMKLPEVRGCPVKACQTQLKHVHGGREFRGQPFFKKQNPKIGELYPNLNQYKRKNRRKINGNN